MSYQKYRHYSVPILLQTSALLHADSWKSLRGVPAAGRLRHAVLAAGGSSPAAMALLAAGSSHASFPGRRGKEAHRLSLKNLAFLKPLSSRDAAPCAHSECCRMAGNGRELCKLPALLPFLGEEFSPRIYIYIFLDPTIRNQPPALYFQ